jgi:hypothetical protein
MILIIVTAAIRLVRKTPMVFRLDKNDPIASAVYKIFTFLLPELKQ